MIEASIASRRLREARRASTLALVALAPLGSWRR